MERSSLSNMAGGLKGDARTVAAARSTELPADHSNSTDRQIAARPADDRRRDRDPAADLLIHRQLLSPPRWGFNRSRDDTGGTGASVRAGFDRSRMTRTARMDSVRTALASTSTGTLGMDEAGRSDIPGP